MKWIHNDARGEGGFFFDADPFYYWAVPVLNPRFKGWQLLIYHMTERYGAEKIFEGIYKTKAEAMIEGYKEYEGRCKA